MMFSICVLTWPQSPGRVIGDETLKGNPKGAGCKEGKDMKRRWLASIIVHSRDPSLIAACDRARRRAERSKRAA